jgi:hypothetical protein
VGNILAIVIEREIGSVDRFNTSGQLTSHAGLVPTVHASGGKARFGRMRKPSSQYLKWAFIEAADVVVRHRRHPAWSSEYVCQVCEGVCRRKGHAVAVGAVARHLAEAAFWIPKRPQPYRPPPCGRPVDSPKGRLSQAGARACPFVSPEIRELIAWHLLDLLMPLDGV